jgi:nitrogen fixation protein NifU and related proteins
MAYSEKVIDHYENPRNVGSFDKGDDSVGTGMVGAPACGDVMKLQIKVNTEGVITDAKFKTYGCGVSNRQFKPCHRVGQGKNA